MNPAFLPSFLGAPVDRTSAVCGNNPKPLKANTERPPTSSSSREIPVTFDLQAKLQEELQRSERIIMDGHEVVPRFRVITAEGDYHILVQMPDDELAAAGASEAGRRLHGLEDGYGLHHLR